MSQSQVFRFLLNDYSYYFYNMVPIIFLLFLHATPPFLYWPIYIYPHFYLLSNVLILNYLHIFISIYLCYMDPLVSHHIMMKNVILYVSPYYHFSHHWILMALNSLLLLANTHSYTLQIKYHPPTLISSLILLYSQILITLITVILIYIHNIYI